jgi:hypothetical protein
VSAPLEYALNMMDTESAVYFKKGHEKECVLEFVWL